MDDRAADGNAQYIVAVSGGVDSVLLLDEMIRQNVGSLVVAHVDHGIREESGDDAQLVRSLASRHNLPFVMTELNLGAQASEEQARDARYAFLRQVAREHGGALIATGHHADDVVETIAINILRGTGWRGLAVLGANDVHRPLTKWFKDEIIDEATRRNLTWNEDATNASDVYLRNRVRRKASQLSKEQKRELLALWRAQHELKSLLTVEAGRLRTFRRHPFIMMDQAAAIEILRSTIAIPLTRPQLVRALLAVKTAQPGSVHHLTKEWELHFTPDTFACVRRRVDE